MRVMGISLGTGKDTQIYSQNRPRILLELFLPINRFSHLVCGLTTTSPKGCISLSDKGHSGELWKMEQMKELCVITIVDMLKYSITIST